MSELLLTPRWYPLKPHPVQMAWMKSEARFNVVPAGRRSGKTERAKRKLVIKALEGSNYPDASYFAGAPTRDQAKGIWWNDLKALSPVSLIKRVWEGDLMIEYINGARLCVVGLDKPQRIEGRPWNGGVLDEYADMRASAWQANIRPALSDRLGWCDLIGVPEGRNHYYDKWEMALADGVEWRGFTWKSADILPKHEIESAKRDMDELVFQQEYEASFLNFMGRIYYAFDRSRNTSKELVYRPELPLIFCFDFNVAPGVAVVCQEWPKLPQPSGLPGTAIIGQVHIPTSSNTVVVCNRLINDWKHHKGRVYCYGDSTGGASGSAKVEGSDWDIIRKTLRPVFADRLTFDVPASNPAERKRVNAVNTRFYSAAGEIRAMAHPQNAAMLVKDFEGVRCIEGGSGEIDKKSDKNLTHSSDAYGYYIAKRFPINANTTTREIDI